jgi:hypothetical protein
MTIACLVRGKAETYNALLVDTGAMRSDGEVFHFDKLYKPFGDTFVTCVGDAGILPILLSRVSASRRRPNLRDRGFIASLFRELDVAHETGLLLGRPTQFGPLQPSTTLAVCSRAEVFFWKAERDPVTLASVAPDEATFLRPEQMIVLRGVTVATVHGFTTIRAEELERVAVDNMINVNAHLETGGADKLGYRMSRAVSGVILPHRTSDALTRIDCGAPPDPIGSRFVQGSTGTPDGTSA